MATLYITEQNAILRKTGDRLVVEKDREVLLEVPCLKLDSVLVFGNVQFTTQAAAELLDHGIELALLSMNGRLRGQLTPPKAKNVYLRMGQYDLSRSEEFCLAFSRELVQAKIESSAAVLRRLRRNHPEAVAMEAIQALAGHAAAAAGASSVDALRGIEGTAAARYFRAAWRSTDSARRPCRRLSEAGERLKSRNCPDQEGGIATERRSGGCDHPRRRGLGTALIRTEGLRPPSRCSCWPSRRSPRNCSDQEGGIATEEPPDERLGQDVVVSELP